MPRSGKPQRFWWAGIRGAVCGIRVIGWMEEKARGPREAPGLKTSELGRLLDGDGAAALALAGVLARAARVAGLAAALTLARVHPLAGVLHVGRSAATLALARVLPRTAGVATLAAALALAGVLARAHVLVGGRGLVVG